jgi:acetyltransferase-like isoleucine patch superfamily enzyme
VVNLTSSQRRLLKTSYQRALIEQYAEYPRWLERDPAQKFEPQVILSLERVFVHPSARIDAFVKIEGGEGVYIGPNVHIASFCHLNIGGGILIIEEGARCSSGSKFVSGSHVQEPLQQSQNIERSVVRIGRNALVFTNAVVLPGCSVGRNSVVGAGAVLTRDVPDGEIWVGNPAKKVGDVK